jgi:hypothetical protein
MAIEVIHLIFFLRFSKFTAPSLIARLQNSLGV